MQLATLAFSSLEPALRDDSAYLGTSCPVISTTVLIKGGSLANLCLRVSAIYCLRWSSVSRVSRGMAALSVLVVAGYCCVLRSAAEPPLFFLLRSGLNSQLLQLACCAV